MSADEPIEIASSQPLAAEDFSWPVSTLDPVARMRALAAGLAHCAVRETVLDAEFSRVWRLVTDFENATAKIEGLVREVEIVDKTERGLILRSRMLSGLWSESDVRLEPGWCLMTSASGHIGMAAHPESASTTRFLHFETSTRFARLLRPLFHWNIGGDFKRIAALLAASSAPRE